MPFLTPARFACLEVVRGVQPSANHLVKVGREFGDEIARWAFAQSHLREQARTKFELADQMLFDRDALPMASHSAVATYHASLFPEGITVEDLTTGIGSDTIALARRGPVIGFELDADRAELAAHNLKVHGLEAEIRNTDSVAETQSDYVFADPARRSGGTRHKSFEDFQPNPNHLVKLFATRKLGVIKLSPMLPDSVLEELAEGGRVRFLSYGRECREVLVMLGTEVSPGWDSVHVESGILVDKSNDYVESSSDGKYLLELDPAMIRARTISRFLSEHQLNIFADSIHFAVSHQQVDAPVGAKFEIVALLPSDRKRVKTWIQESGATWDAIKVSGVDIDPREFEIKTGGKGPRKWTGIVYTEGKSVRVAVALRL